jgi:hypothetical protein
VGLSEAPEDAISVTRQIPFRITCQIPFRLPA